MPEILLRALLLLCAVLAANTRAGEPVAYTVPVAPWTFPDDPAHGVASEYLRYLFNGAQVPMQFGTLPYARVINGLRDGSNVASMLIPDAERDTFALRLCEVTTIRSGLLYKKERFGTLTPAALPGLTIGFQRGTHALDKLDKTPAIKSYTLRTVEQGLKMLKQDHLDATFLSSPGSDILLRTNGLAAADYGWLEVDVAPVVIYISRKAALAQDEAALQRLRVVCDGQARALMGQLMKKYH